MFVRLCSCFYGSLFLSSLTWKKEQRKERYHLRRAFVTQYSIWLSKYKGQVTCKYVGPLSLSQLITVSRFIISANYSGSLVRVEPWGAVMMYVLKQLLPGACTQWVGQSDLLVHLHCNGKVSGNARGTTFWSLFGVVAVSKLYCKVAGMRIKMKGGYRDGEAPKLPLRQI